MTHGRRRAGQRRRAASVAVMAAYGLIYAGSLLLALTVAGVPGLTTAGMACGAGVIAAAVAGAVLSRPGGDDDRHHHQGGR